MLSRSVVAVLFGLLVPSSMCSGAIAEDSCNPMAYMIRLKAPDESEVRIACSPMRISYRLRRKVTGGRGTSEMVNCEIGISATSEEVNIIGQKITRDDSNFAKTVGKMKCPVPRDADAKDKCPKGVVIRGDPKCLNILKIQKTLIN